MPSRSNMKTPNEPSALSFCRVSATDWEADDYERRLVAACRLIADGSIVTSSIGCGS